MANTKTLPRLPKSSDPFQRVAFYGQMASGKTFLAMHLVSHHRYYRIAFADKLKAIAYDLFGVQGKDGNNRVVLQQLGDAMRSIDKDVWVKYAISTLKYKMDNGTLYKNQPIVIDDLRLKNEAEWLKRNGFTLIRVDVDENVRLARVSTLYPNTAPEAILHASEREWEGIVPDHIILNNDITSIFDLNKLIGSEE